MFNSYCIIIMEEPFSTRSSKRHALRSAFHLLLDVIYLYKSSRWDISYWAFIWIVMVVSWRTQGKDGFLGRCVMSPTVRLHGHETPEPRLQWFKIKRGDEEGGDLLAACELFLVRVLDFFLCFPIFRHCAQLRFSEGVLSVYLFRNSHYVDEPMLRYEAVSPMWCGGSREVYSITASCLCSITRA